MQTTITTTDESILDIARRLRSESEDMEVVAVCQALLDINTSNVNAMAVLKEMLPRLDGKDVRVRGS